MSSAEPTAAPSTSVESPAWNLITNLDVRLESLQQLITGELRPLERRANLVQNRREALGSGDLFVPGEGSSQQLDQDTQDQADGDTEPEPDGGTDRINTGQSEQDVGAKTTAREAENTQDSHPASIPSMSEAVEQKMGARED